HASPPTYHPPSPTLSSWLLRAGEEFGEVVVDAGDAEVGLAAEGTAQVVDAVPVAVEEFDEGEYVVVGLVEAVEDLVFGDCDRVGAGDAAFDFDEAQLAGGGVAALDVVAEFFVLAVYGLVAESALDLHHDGSGTGGAGLGV